MFIRTAVWLALCGSALFASPITLTPGSLLIQQVALPSLTIGNLAGYSKAGALIATAQISGTNDLPENLTVLGGDLYVSDGAGYINRINLSSGSVASGFYTGTFGLNGVGTYNGNLLALTFSSQTVKVYSPAGVLLQSVVLASTPAPLDWNGITSDGSVFYLADYQSGRLYKYSATGAALGFIGTGAVGGLSGVAYDSSNDSLWVSDAASNRVLDISTSGTQLSQFSTGTFRPGSGIALVPVPTPEPGYQALLALGLAAAWAGKAKRSHRAQRP